ncbi:MAG: hypothetical protein MMC33_005336 [Icmadophila ericetorum]|nr:hypothetical protein [Icmadophila ericetorum]
MAAQLNHTLCGLCQNLSVKKLSARQEALGETNEEYGCSHHKSFSALTNSAETCALCKLFALTISRDNGWFLGGTMKAPQITDEESSSSQTEIRLLGLSFPFDQSVPPGLSHLSVGHSKRNEVLALYSEAGDDPAAKHGDITGRKVKEHPGSKESLNLVKFWLHNCLENHRECGEFSTEERPLPTRVIDLGVKGEAEALILVETNGRSGQYITLSHRWAKASEMIN